MVWWDHERDEAQRPEPVAASFLDWLEAEIREREADPKGSLLTSLSSMYARWIREALTRGRGT